MSSKLIFILLFNLSMAGMVCAQPDLSLQAFKSGFNRPVDIDHAGDGRLFITEQNGRIRIIDEAGQLLVTPFLDLQLGQFGGGNERGLLGLAFHPDYQNNGFFYVNFTDQLGDTRIERYRVMDSDPNRADPASQSLLLAIDQPFSNHNGGDMNFGPDGYLYISSGDGGSANDPQGNGQKRITLLGKILRIDVDVANGYAIPPSNPFAEDDFTLDEIWALGLRNPWRFSFDRLTGDMWIGDVGQDDWEEIDYQPAASNGGENYGWKCFEGNALFSNASPCTGNPADYTAPLQQYESKSSTDGCSVTGGYVYRGEAFPDMYGHYIYADYCSGKFWSLSRDCDSNWVNQFLFQGASFEYSGFGEDRNGELYVAALNQGRIYKVTAAACSGLDLCVQTTDESCREARDGRAEVRPVGGVAPFEYQLAPPDNLEAMTGSDYILQLTDGRGCTTQVSFTVSTTEKPAPASITQDGNTLSVPPDLFTYQWYLDDTPIEEATTASIVASASGRYQAELFSGPNCSIFSDELNVVISDVAELPEIQPFMLSPNPFQNEFYYRLHTTSRHPIQLSVLDVTGRTIWQKILPAPARAEEKLDLTPYPSGIYFFTIHTGAKVAIRKMVKR